MLIKEAKNNEKDNINDNLLGAINNLNLNDDSDINLNEDNNDGDEGQYFLESIDNDSEKSINSEEEDIDIENSNEYKLKSLYDRMLSDKRFIDYKDVILTIKNKNQKRLKCSGESEDEEIISKKANNEIKKKIRYPKKNNL